MRRLYRLIFLLPVLLAAVSCGEGIAGEDEHVSIDKLDDALQFAAEPAEGETVTFTLSASQAWSIRKDGLDWLKISPMQGLEGKKTVTLTPIRNADPASRRGSFTITSGKKFTRTVTVSQDGLEIVPAFTVEALPDEGLSFAATDVERTFKVSSNMDWTVSLDGLDWCKVSPMEGGRGRVATITVLPGKNEGAAREGSILFNFGGESPLRVNVAQAVFVPELSIAPESVRASAVGVLDQDVIHVSANGTWVASLSDRWIYLTPSTAPGDMDVVISLSENTSESPRTGTVVFDNHGVKSTLTITQKGKTDDKIAASATALAMSGDGKAVTVDIESNVDWAVTADSWLHVSPASGSGNATLTITGDTNDTASERTGTIVIADVVDPLLSVTITVTQELYVDLSGYADLLTTPVVWVCNDYDGARALNPDFPSAGQTGVVTGKGTGVFYSNTLHPQAYAEFIKADNGFSYTTLFIIASDGHYAFKKYWTDDAIVFHIPVTRIVKDQLLHFKFALRGVGTAPQYYAGEVSFDAGKTWLAMDTGNTYNLGSNFANAKIAAANKASSFDASLTIPVTLEMQELLLRIRCSSGGTLINGSTVTSPPENGTLRLTNSTPLSINGPTVYVTE